MKQTTKYWLRELAAGFGFVVLLAALFAFLVAVTPPAYGQTITWTLPAEKPNEVIIGGVVHHNAEPKLLITANKPQRYTMPEMGCYSVKILARQVEPYALLYSTPTAFGCWSWCIP